MGDPRPRCRRLWGAACAAVVGLLTAAGPHYRVATARCSDTLRWPSRRHPSTRCDASWPAPAAARRTLGVVPSAAPGLSPVTFFPNTGQPVPVRTRGFWGLLLCRTRTPEDPHFRRTVDGRMLEIQIQGQFMDPPRGPVWFGLEVTAPVPLPLARLVAMRALLGVVRTLGWTFHASLGGGEGELPHIVYPLLSAMDCVVINSPAEPPPPLGGPVEASSCPRLESRDVSLGTRYTLGYFSRFLDLEAWALVGVPGFGPLDLHHFWGNATLRFVLYAHPATHGPHRPEDRQLFLDFEIVHRSLPRYRDLPLPPPLQR